jgi:hypothetical protein
VCSVLHRQSVAEHHCTAQLIKESWISAQEDLAKFLKKMFIPTDPFERFLPVPNVGEGIGCCGIGFFFLQLI